MGININVTNQPNIMIIDIYITYSVFSWLPLPNVHPVPLASNFVWIPKHRHFLMRGP